MSEKLYIECSSGISGDMFVAALLDLGADQNKLEQVLRTIPDQRFRVVISKVIKSGLEVCDFNVILEESLENHDHDMEFLYGHSHKQEEKTAKHQHMAHGHRTLSEVIEILKRTRMSENAYQIAERIFHILGEAEAKAHGTSLEEVHFHEVGALDSIVDIISAAVCMDDLNIKEVIIPELYEGTGMIHSQHGYLPVPVPAVLNVVEKYNLKMTLTETRGELITPTGAAIAAAIQTETDLPKEFSILSSGLGAGKRKYDRPGILRVMKIQTSEKTAEKNVIWKMECNLDDCTGENMGYLMDLLYQKGAREVNFTPVFMKKNRPGYLLTVLADENDVEHLESLLFMESTTIGIRKEKMERTILARETVLKTTSYGTISAKKCILPDGNRIYPEFSEVKRISGERGIPFSDLFHYIYVELNKSK